MEPNNLDDFLKLCNDAESLQRQVLHDILSYSKETEIGRKLGFGEMEDIATYRRRVPLSSWEDVAPYAKRLEKGENDLLFPGRPPYFICTSGTTGGVKIIPESQRGQSIKSLTGRLRIEAIARHVPKMMKGKLFPLVNHAVEGVTPGGIPYGSASGITLVTAPETIRKMIAFPMAVLDIDYSNRIDYILMRFAVAEDVRAIFGNNAGRIAQLLKVAQQEAEAIIEDIENGTLRGIETLSAKAREALESVMRPDPATAERLRRFLVKEGTFAPSHYWPNLRVIACWLSGSVGRYVSSLRPLVDADVRFFDVGYGATEGKFNIPLAPETPSGPLAIHAAFYEFRIPGTDTCLLAHEVEENESYELVITTYSGLYRYTMGDLVRVTGFTGSTPHILFEQKVGDMLNLCGEKVAATSLMPMVARAVEETTGHPPRHWCVVSESDRHRYRFCIELSEAIEADGTLAETIARRLEAILQDESLIYPIFRQQKLLEPLAVTLMASGWQEALYRRHTRPNQSRTQVKLPLVYNEIPQNEFSIP
ncbi:GH3 auxin-responsive promoter family protein [Hydrogenimonas urashimensis]|uniref:GH3 auxin-responsive promoter family protein n=1 Tax=Hydrogenimonas urashimensis TaxID=2740515 RepID=UPI001915F728|nr:GH3 auxin-responsive promoter family protein [Hydrogenimonas urashimensis]